MSTLGSGSEICLDIILIAMLYAVLKSDLYLQKHSIIWSEMVRVCMCRQGHAKAQRT